MVGERVQTSFEEVSIPELEKQSPPPRRESVTIKMFFRPEVWFLGYEASPLSWSSREPVCKLKKCSIVLTCILVYKIGIAISVLLGLLWCVNNGISIFKQMSKIFQVFFFFSTACFPCVLYHLLLYEEKVLQSRNEVYITQEYFPFKNPAVLFWQLPSTPVVSFKICYLGSTWTVCGKGKQNSLKKFKHKNGTYFNMNL